MKNFVFIYIWNLYEFWWAFIITKNLFCVLKWLSKLCFICFWYSHNCLLNPQTLLIWFPDLIATSQWVSWAGFEYSLFILQYRTSNTWNVIWLYSFKKSIASPMIPENTCLLILLCTQVGYNGIYIPHPVIQVKKKQNSTFILLHCKF